MKLPLGWTIEDTGGGCQWIRKGRIAITDGDASVPEWGKPCVVVTINNDGDYDEMPAMDFPSLESAIAFLNAPAAK